MGVPANAGTAGGWVFGAGKCREIAIWVPANAGAAGLRAAAAPLSKLLTSVCPLTDSQ